MMAMPHNHPFEAICTPECPANPEKSLGYSLSSSSPIEFQERVLNILEGSAILYKDRNAIYKDNFRAVGRMMVAMFPEGRPPLRTAEDYDRWHIFELLIVKLTRYANNYDVPHEDSLLDMIPYLGILGGLDQELHERELSKPKFSDRQGIKKRPRTLADRDRDKLLADQERRAKRFDRAQEMLDEMAEIDDPEGLDDIL